MTRTVTDALLRSIAGLLALALLASLAHLGRAPRAWRSASNARTSALSREVISLLLFAAAVAAAWVRLPAADVALGLFALTFLAAMADVYRLEAVPGWPRRRVAVSFATSALVLGALTVLTTVQALPTAVLAPLGLAALVWQVARRVAFYHAPRGKVMS